MNPEAIVFTNLHHNLDFMILEETNTKPGNDRTPEQNLWPRNSYLCNLTKVDQSGITYCGI